jgi:radical SAM-linked protein
MRFERKNSLRFISHLEQIELIKLMLRRTELPLIYSQGFHPQVKVSFGPAISVGYESESEYVDLELGCELNTGIIAKQISAQLPAGFNLLELKQINNIRESLEAEIDVAEYHIAGIESIHIEGIADKIKVFLSPEQIIIQKIKKDKIIEVDVKPQIIRLEYLNEILVLVIRLKQPVKPEKIVQKLLNLTEPEAKILNINRKQFYVEKKNELICLI